MKTKNYRNSLLLALGISLAACGGGGGGGGNPSPDPTPDPLPDPSPVAIEVLNISGSTSVLDGNWQSACFAIDSGTNSIRFSFTFGGSTRTTITDMWLGNTTCSGVAASSTSYTTSIETEESSASIAGWGNLDLDTFLITSAAAPTAEDGSSPLTDAESYTIVNFTVTENNGSPLTVGSTGMNSYIVDSTGDYPVLYPVVFDPDSSQYVALVNQYLAKPTQSNINITTMNGNALNLTGSWSSACLDMSGSGVTYEFSITPDNVWSYTNKVWTNNSCSVLVDSLHYSGIVSTGANETLTEWIGSTPAANSIPGSEINYTLINVTLTSAPNPEDIGATIPTFYVVDDANLNSPVLYQGIGTTTTAYDWYSYNQM